MLQLNHSAMKKKIIYLGKNRAFRELELLIDKWLKTILINANINDLELIVKMLSLDDYQLYGLLISSTTSPELMSFTALSQLYPEPNLNNVS